MNCKKCKYRAHISGYVICNYSELGKTCLYLDENGEVKDRRGEGECKLFEKGNPKRNKIKEMNRIRYKNEFE